MLIGKRTEGGGEKDDDDVDNFFPFFSNAENRSVARRSEKKIEILPSFFLFFLNLGTIS